MESSSNNKSVPSMLQDLLAESKASSGLVDSWLVGLAQHDRQKIWNRPEEEEEEIPLPRAIVGHAGVGSLSSTKPIAHNKEDPLLRSIRKHMPQQYTATRQGRPQTRSGSSETGDEEESRFKAMTLHQTGSRVAQQPSSKKKRKRKQKK